MMSNGGVTFYLQSQNIRITVHWKMTVEFSFIHTIYLTLKTISLATWRLPNECDDGVKQKYMEYWIREKERIEFFVDELNCQPKKSSARVSVWMFQELHYRSHCFQVDVANQMSLEASKSAWLYAFVWTKMQYMCQCNSTPSPAHQRLSRSVGERSSICLFNFAKDWHYKQNLIQSSLKL